MSLQQFDELMAHLNAEDNELAAEFRNTLSNLVWDSEFLDCLKASGVDNWDGYGEAFEMMEGQYERHCD